MSEPRYSKLQDWLQWQESLHGQEIDLGLERIRKVYQLMRTSCQSTNNTVTGIGWKGTQFITVGGTNGKGSTIAFLNAIYQQAGYKVGQFTSPHFLRYNERVQINSQQIDDQSLCDAFAEIDKVREDISLTYFEFSTLAALWCFAQQQVDVVLLEVGLGGRLDASNLMDADCSIVTSIGMDHRDWLGDTREQIGFEKAGIFRQGKPAICGDLEIPSTVEQYARDIGARWLGRGQQFEIERGGDSWMLKLELEREQRAIEGLAYPELLAPVQLNNVACAVVAVELLQRSLPVAKEAVNQGIRIAAVPGRMDRRILAASQLEVILDVAHNAEAARAVVEAVQTHYTDRSVHLVLGMLADKEVSATVEQLSCLVSQGYIASPQSPRALNADRLLEQVKQAGWPSCEGYTAVAQAFQQACADAQETGGLVLVLGSFFTVAEVMGEIESPRV